MLWTCLKIRFAYPGSSVEHFFRYFSDIFGVVLDKLANAYYTVSRQKRIVSFFVRELI